MEIFLQSINTILVLVGAVWAYFRFFREGSHKSRIEFDIEADFQGPQKGEYIAAFQIRATNKGNVEHEFDSIRLRVRGVKKDSDLKYLEGKEPMLSFPEKNFDTVEIIPKKIGYYFVRPGVDQRFSYVTKLPSSWSTIICRATFKYRNGRELHTAERVFSIHG